MMLNFCYWVCELWQCFCDCGLQIYIDVLVDVIGLDDYFLFVEYVW